jgi:hypothetical protein
MNADVNAEYDTPHPSFVSVPLLGAIKAAGVEHLEVDVTLSTAEKAFAASISTLTTLKELVLTLTPESLLYEDRPSTGRLCTALHPLTNPTRLEALVNPGAAQHLPPSLRELELLARQPSIRYRHPASCLVNVAEPNLQPQPDQTGVADLGHLTALTHLTLRNGGPGEQSYGISSDTCALQVSLPADLKLLKVFGYASISALHRLGRAELLATRPCDLDVLRQLAPCRTVGLWSCVSASAGATGTALTHMAACTTLMMKTM